MFDYKVNTIFLIYSTYVQVFIKQMIEYESEDQEPSIDVLDESSLTFVTGTEPEFR